jgi:hypothetical protein
MFSEVYLFFIDFWYFNWLETFRALDRENLMKKVGFEMFSKVYLFLLISSILIGWGLSVP